MGNIPGSVGETDWDKEKKTKNKFETSEYAEIKDHVKELHNFPEQIIFDLLPVLFTPLKWDF